MQTGEGGLHSGLLMRSFLCLFPSLSGYCLLGAGLLGAGGHCLAQFACTGYSANRESPERQAINVSVDVSSDTNTASLSCHHRHPVII